MSAPVLPVTTTCPTCGSLLWWRARSGARVCARCHPDPMGALDPLTRRVREETRAHG